MCGRYSNVRTWQELRDLYGIHDAQPALNLAPRYNIAPTQDAPVVRRDGEGLRHLDQLRWGLVPSWAKDLKIGVQCINARAESIDQKPAFREAFKRRRRCLVPADSYYEWRLAEDGKKQPYRVSRADGQPMTFAGLWDGWRDREAAAENPDTPWLRSYTIVTTDASASAARVHDRMPAVLDADEWEPWLMLPPAEAKSLLKPWPGELIIEPVSRAMSSGRIDTAEGAQVIGPALQAIAI